ncbi:MULTISPECIES: type II toxin-antitoxin system RelB family antitoxin [Methylobacterium]|uniref:type II toxin-antitoxin system RelB family antitoxin n=1 Tax=Methylobacterium TaxID=407 RepID=UPI00104442E5|nr:MULTISPECIES: ribbon-helix-helix protein, CopG family [Methylobacterium]MDR7037584.1 RHH-type rel operon transcriptional repressor/antitoxin RelB [Methylobacterium sp. BE186]
MLALDLPADLERRLDALARRTGLSASEHVREALREHLDNLDDIELAERRLGALRRGESGTTSLDALIARYGLED